MERIMKIGRNDPCPCGSGKKYKHCCYAKDSVKHEPEAVAEEQTLNEGVDAAGDVENVEAGRKHGRAQDKGRRRFHGNSSGESGSFSPRPHRGSQRGS